MRQHCECAVQRRQLVCSTCHRLHKLFWRYILSCRLHCIDGVYCLRCGSICSVRWCVHGMCFRVLLRCGCTKLHRMRFG